MYGKSPTLNPKWISRIGHDIVTEIKYPFRVQANNVICDDISDLNKVNYLIQLNVLCMMLANVATVTDIYFTIEEPDYNTGNIS